MTIKELKEVIKNLPDNMEIIMQRDSEGNGHSPLGGVDSNSVYEAQSKWDGYAYSLEHDKDFIDKKRWDIIKSKPKVLVLFPLG